MITGSSGDDSLYNRSGLWISDAGVVVEDTTIRDNDVGIGTREIPSILIVRNSELRNNGAAIEYEWEPAYNTTVRNTVIAGNDVSVRYSGSDLRNVYWGASDGPSSVYRNETSAPRPWRTPSRAHLLTEVGTTVEL